MSARHPTPWTQTDFLVGKGKKKRVEWSSITDARNEFVVESLDEETAQEIVEVVNGSAHLRHIRRRSSQRPEPHRIPARII